MNNFKLPKENNIVFYNGGSPIAENEVMRIDRQGIKVNPTLSTDEATNAVICALEGYIKNLAKTEYERGLKEALAQSQGDVKQSAERVEPVAKPHKGEPVLWAAKESMFMWGNSDESGHPYHIICKGKKVKSHQIPLYTTPQQRPSRSDIKPLTEQEFEKLHHEAKGYVVTGLMDIVRIVEAAHGIKE